MKRLLPTTQYYFYAGSNYIDFSMFPDFDPKRLLAVINTTRDQTLIYATGGGPSSHTKGNFSGSTGSYQLYLVFDCASAGMSDSDILELIYDESVGMEEAKASIDIVSGKAGLDVNLLNSSFGGTVGDVMPAPFQDNALSIGILNGGVLESPAMNVNNELIIDATQSGNVPVSFSGVLSSDMLSFGGGNSLTFTQPLPATPTNPSTGAYASFGPGGADANTTRVAIVSDQSQIPVVIKDLVVTGVATNLAVTNLLTNGATLTDTTNYTNVTCQIVTTSGASGSISFESSLDGVNFKPIPMTDTSGVTTTGVITITGAVNNIYSGNVQGIWFRVRSPSGMGAGTARAIATFSCDTSNPLLLSLDSKLNTLGQKASSASMPVVVASDQIIPVSIPDLFITGQSAQSVAINNIIPTTAGANATDAAGYRSASIQVVSTATAGTLTFENSNDNVSWSVMPVFNQALLNGGAIVTGISATASQIVYVFPIQARYIRLRISSSLTGGSVQAFTRLSQAPFSPVTNLISQATAGNLNMTATIASGTVTTVSTVTAVSSAALQSATTTDISLATFSATATSANVAMTNIQCVSFQLAVTAITGILDTVVQETWDGTNYVDIYHFPRITSAGQYQSPNIRLTGIGIRYVRTVSGGTPSITMSAVRISRQISSSNIKSFINRTIDPNTLNSATSSFLSDGCDKFQLCASLSAGGTGTATFKLQGSEDQSSWYDLGGSSSAVSSSGSTAISYSGMLPKYVRAITTSVGVGLTLSQVCIKAMGN